MSSLHALLHHIDVCKAIHRNGAQRFGDVEHLFELAEHVRLDFATGVIAVGESSIAMPAPRSEPARRVLVVEEQRADGTVVERHEFAEARRG
jgi:hypothetical protein